MPLELFVRAESQSTDLFPVSSRIEGRLVRRTYFMAGKRGRHSPCSTIELVVVLSRRFKFYVCFPKPKLANEVRQSLRNIVSDSFSLILISDWRHLFWGKAKQRICILSAARQCYVIDVGKTPLILSWNSINDNSVTTLCFECNKNKQCVTPVGLYPGEFLK